MGPRLLTALALTFALPCGAAELPNQTVVFYNARIALREDRPRDVLKLWLLRNSLADLGERPENDGDFESAVWAAMGEMGTCPDGFSRDERGAGLWPVAMHNWVLDAARRGPAAPGPPPFGAFEVGRQQRKVSLDDVLSDSELRSLTFHRTNCLAAAPWLLQSAQNPRAKLRDRRITASLMRRFLASSLGTLDRSKVESVAVIEARLFDLDLAILELETRHATKEGLRAQAEARRLGVSTTGASEVRASFQPAPHSAADSAQGKLLRRSLQWSVADWMSLSRARRLFLFDQARAFSQDAEALDRLVLGVIDELIERNAGTELEMWIGMFGAETAERRAPLVAGDRGARLLELDRATGFRERSVIALHRGVGFLEAGELDEALRAFAFSMAHADDSRESGTVLALARRWLSYVLTRYETTDEVVAILEALVPKQEFNAVVEDLIWRAALRADAKSFDRAIANTRRGGAFDLQVQRLRTLSRGKAGELVTGLRQAAETEPNLTLRFAGTLIEHVEAEDAEVRAANVPLLRELIHLLEPLTGGPGKRKTSSARAAEEHLGRVHSILEGLRELEVSSPEDKARTQSPARDTFAGAIRLAPADPLPWPFSRPEPEAPSAFTPLALDPVEWRNGAGQLVFGWRISDGTE